MRFIRRPDQSPDLFLNNNTEQDIAPEDIFSDSYSSLPNEEYNPKQFEKPVENKMFFIGLFVMLSLLAGYTLYLTIFEGQKYSELAHQNALRTHEVGPARGEIISNDGQTIADTVSGFNIIAKPRDLSSDNIEFISRSLSEIYPRLSYNRIKSNFSEGKTKNLASVTLVKKLTEKELEKSESILDSFPALVVKETSLRSYPQSNLFAHITGHTAPVNKKDIVESEDYNLSDSIGKKGAESAFEDVLKGEKGIFARYVNATGDVVREELMQEKDRGNILKLTVDANLQRSSYEALRSGLEKNNLDSGTVVALNPQNGKILSMVSLPDYNPNHFAKGLSGQQAAKYFNNSSAPLFNRATSGEYSTGSIIKPLIAAAALEENIIDPEREVLTQGYIEVPSVYDPSVTYRFEDWKNHGYVDMRDAIAVSSNVYFYMLGGGYQEFEGLGIDLIAEYLSKFNWGEKLGINFSSENSGLIPTPEQKQEKTGERWTIGDTYNVSIGQGDLLATPLQVASAFSAFANGGTIYKPFIIDSILSNCSNSGINKDNADVDCGNHAVVENRERGDIINGKFLSRKTVNVAKEGMRQAVVSGSSKFLNQLSTPVAGKTGTAQTSGETPNAWFAGFAPYRNPEILVVVVMEEGESSDKAVRVAHDIFSRYFSEEPEE